MLIPKRWLFVVQGAIVSTMLVGDLSAFRIHAASNDDRCANIDDEASCQDSDSNCEWRSKKCVEDKDSDGSEGAPGVVIAVAIVLFAGFIINRKKIFSQAPGNTQHNIGHDIGHDLGHDIEHDEHEIKPGTQAIELTRATPNLVHSEGWGGDY